MNESFTTNCSTCQIVHCFNFFVLVCYSRRNSHGVSKEAIERLLDRYQRHVTVESLMAMLLPPGERDQLNSPKVDSPAPSPRRDHQQPNRSSDTPIPAPRPRRNSHSRQPSIDKVETSLGDLYFDRNYKTPKEAAEAVGVGSSGGSQHAGTSSADALYVSVLSFVPFMERWRSGIVSVLLCLRSRVRSPLLS